MATEFQLGAQRRRKVGITYGKAPRKRQPKAVFTPVTASESMSEEDPIGASDASLAQRKPPPAPSPKPKSQTTAFNSLDATRNTRTAPPSLHTIPSSDRKRKVSQIYTHKERSRAVESETGEEEPPSAPEPRRSRMTLPENRPAVQSGGKERTLVQRVPPGSMDVDTVGPRLSSPPPTPTPPKAAKLSTKPTSNVPRQKSANAPTTKGAQLQHQIPLHLARDSTRGVKQSSARPVVKEHSRLAPKGKPAGSGLAKEPRKRLIDALVEQDSSETTEEGEDVPDTQFHSSQPIFSQRSDAPELNDQSLPATPQPKTRTAPGTGARTFARSSSALKFTYGQGRKVLEEEDSLLESLALPAESSYTRRRLEPEGPKRPASVTGGFDYDGDDGIANSSPSSKLRDIHELRQAGANSRVADAMQDLIDQIGKPGTSSSSSRRSALLQVAEKMRDKTFIRQCRDHGVESIILKDIGKETDTICGYLILSSLVTIIAKGPSAHVGQLLRTEEAGPIFARLLSIGEDIKTVAKDRKSNLSKRSQSSLIAIESLLRELPIWDGDRPSFISPRSLVIKCLQLLIAQDVLIGRDPTIFTEAVRKHLFEVLSDASDNTAYWDYPKTVRSVELCGALSVLDFHAISVAATQGGSSEWARQYLPIIADAFYASLQTPSNGSNTVEDMILKLTINVTNNNFAAPSIFAAKGLLPALAASISSNFDHALALISQDSWAEGILDSLVLRLGILINFAEHSDLVRQIVNDCQHESQEPVKELIRLFIENHRRTSEADSMEKTHLNVAFGYLSVLLGYLALHGPVRQKFISSHSARSIGPLVGSIREFIAHYEQVENALSENDDGVRSHGSYTKQLQELVQQLEDNAAHD